MNKVVSFSLSTFETKELACVRISSGMNLTANFLQNYSSGYSYDVYTLNAMIGDILSASLMG
jgi:hypothetical protein